MKVIQVSIDDVLLRRVDSDLETKKVGRSAVVRRALAEYLRRSEANRIREAYRRGYGEHPADEDTLGPWEGQAWPDE